MDSLAVAWRTLSCRTLAAQADRDGFRGTKADAQERNIKARPRPLFDVVDMHKAKKAMARLDQKYSGAGNVKCVSTLCFMCACVCCAISH
jgi:hypothetical protein